PDPVVSARLGGGIEVAVSDLQRGRPAAVGGRAVARQRVIAACTGGRTKGPVPSGVIVPIAGACITVLSRVMGVTVAGMFSWPAQAAAIAPASPMLVNSPAAIFALTNQLTARFSPLGAAALPQDA